MYDLNDHLENGRMITVPQQIFIHPRWNPNAMKYNADLAILEPERSITFTIHISPICLWNSQVSVPASKGTVIGYGKSEDESRKHENIPRQIEVPIIDLQQCHYKEPILATISSPYTFCAGSADGSGVCSGDSGNGLFFKDAGKFFLLGIVSSSLVDNEHKCDVTRFALYTDVLKYKDWIENPSNEYEPTNYYGSTTRKNTFTTRKSATPSKPATLRQLATTTKSIPYSIKKLVTSTPTPWITNKFQIAFTTRMYTPFLPSKVSVPRITNGGSMNSLKELNFAGSSLKKVTKNKFIDLFELRKLNLKNNEINEIEERSFNDLINLQELNLAYNSLEFLHGNLFEKLQNLRELYLEYNSLERLNENLFLGTGKLEILNLNKNKLSSLPEKLFHRLKDLKTLYLHENRLTSLSENLFKGSTQLRTLQCSYNEIAFLPQNIFWNLSELEEIFLSWNKLRTLPVKIFRNNRKLQRILLRSNQLENIPSDSFDGLNAAKYIVLEYNRCISKEFGKYTAPAPLTSEQKFQLKNELQRNC